LRVRMGLHTGSPETRQGDYFDPVLNRAARLMAVAHGRQIVVSSATEQLARDNLPLGIGLLDLGEHRLADLSRSERMFQVTDLDFPVSPRRALLVLDNCEHLADALAVLAEELLRHCPGVALLATSREAVGVPGEMVWRVPSLSVPVAATAVG
jgi:hypothetical protein